LISKRLLLIFTFVCAFTLEGFSQEEELNALFDKPETPSEKNIWNYFTYDMGNVFAGVGYAYSRPLLWQ